MKRLLAALGFLVFLSTALPAADGAGRADSQRSKIASIEAQISAKKAVIRQTWREVGRLDHLIAQAIPPVPESPPSSEESATGEERAEALLDQSFQRESLESQRRQALQGLLSAYREVGYLEEEIRTARAQLGRKPLLEGDWTLALLPNGARGQVSLTQNGTLVEGVYVMESGLSGNLQGTYINGQLTLERIDSKYGKMGRLEGQLMKDGSHIQGSWYSYDLQSGNPLTGAFTLERPEGGPEGRGAPAPGTTEGVGRP